MACQLFKTTAKKPTCNVVDGVNRRESVRNTGSATIVADYTIEAVESQPFAEMSYIVWRQGRH